MDAPIWHVDNFCRACVQELNPNKTGEVAACVNIFETCDFLNKLTACISNEFSTNKCSKYLCIRCYQKVNEFYEFRVMCIDSIRRFEELQHQVGSTFREKITCSLLNEVDIKKKCELAHQAATSSTLNASIPLSDSINELKEYEESMKYSESETGTISNLSERKKIMKKKGRKQRQKRVETLVESTPTTVVGLVPDVDTKNESVSDRDHLKSNDVNDFPNNSLLNENKHSELNVRPIYKCITRKKFKAAKSFAPKTTEIESKTTIYRCDICSSRFFVEHRLIAHSRVHKGLIPYPCTREGCDKSFNRWSELSRHLSQHTDQSIVYVCDQTGCDKVYKYKSALNMHKRKHHKLGPELKSHVCEICGKVFKSATILNEHRYTHKDKSERPYVCDQPNCTQRFANKDKLKVHLKRHAGIKNYVCPHCGMRKTTKNELTVHMNYHTLERTWPCNFCTHVCNSAGNLKTHIRTIHERAKDYACRHCDLRFAKPDTRKYHEMRHTGEKPNICPECGKGFIQPAALRTHMKVHERQRELETAKNPASKQLLTSENELKLNKNG